MTNTPLYQSDLQKYIKAAMPSQVRESVYDSLHSDGSVYNRSGTEAEEAYARFKSGLEKDLGMKPSVRGEHANTYKFRDGSYITVAPKANRELAFVSVYIRPNQDIINSYEKLDESTTVVEASRYDYETHGGDVLIMDVRAKRDFYLQGDDATIFTNELEKWENNNGADEFDNFMFSYDYDTLLESKKDTINEDAEGKQEAYDELWELLKRTNFRDGMKKLSRFASEYKSRNNNHIISSETAWKLYDAIEAVDDAIGDIVVENDLDRA